jgi:hypothetical protein
MRWLSSSGALIMIEIIFCPRDNVTVLLRLCCFVKISKFCKSVASIYLSDSLKGYR